MASSSSFVLHMGCQPDIHLLGVLGDRSIDRFVVSSVSSFPPRPPFIHSCVKKKAFWFRLSGPPCMCSCVDLTSFKRCMLVDSCMCVCVCVRVRACVCVCLRSYVCTHLFSFFVGGHPSMCVVLTPRSFQPFVITQTSARSLAHSYLYEFVDTGR